MREMGVRGLLVFAQSFDAAIRERCADRWPGHVPLSDLEPLFTLAASRAPNSGRISTGVRPSPATLSDRQAWRDMQLVRGEREKELKLLSSASHFLHRVL